MWKRFGLISNAIQGAIPMEMDDYYLQIVREFEIDARGAPCVILYK